MWKILVLITVYIYFSVNKFEVECLLKIFKTACTKGKMDRNRFRDILHIEFSMTDDILMDRGINRLCNVVLIDCIIDLSVSVHLS